MEKSHKLMMLSRLTHGETIDNSDMEESHKLMMLNRLTHGETIDNSDMEKPLTILTWRSHIN